MKDVYLQFLLHCYIDTDAEMKDVYNADYIERILSNILSDISQVFQLSHKLQLSSLWSKIHKYSEDIFRRHHWALQALKLSQTFIHLKERVIFSWRKKKKQVRFQIRRLKTMFVIQ